MSATDKGERIRAQRERELARKCIPPLPESFQTTVVGVSFTKFYPDNLYDLEQASLNAGLLGEDLACVIIRNPENEHDPNACEVHVPALGINGHVGHIAKPLAARMAPDIDNGASWQGTVLYVRVSHDHLDRPGLDIHLYRKEHP